MTYFAHSFIQKYVIIAEMNAGGVISMLRLRNVAKKPVSAKKSKTKEKGGLLFSATWNRDLVQYSPKAHRLLSAVGIARLQRQPSLVYAAVATRRWWRAHFHTEQHTLRFF